jgi:hypothetical protein
MEERVDVCEVDQRCLRLNGKERCLCSSEGVSKEVQEVHTKTYTEIYIKYEYIFNTIGIFILICIIIDVSL